MDKKGYEKFRFIEAEEETEDHNSKADQNKENDQESRVDHKKETTQKSKTDKETADTNKKDDQTKPKKLYFGFKLRVSLLIVVVLVLFVSGFIFMLKALSYSETKTVSYVETSSADYKLCVKTNDEYLKSCVKSYDGQFSNVETVKIDYKYLTKTDDKSKIDLTYQIIAVSRIYDKFDSSRVLYENEKVIVDKTPIIFKKNKASVNEKFTINLQEYNKNVLDYQSKYIYASNAVLEVKTYIENGTDKYSVGSITMPLAVDTFSISKNLVENETRTTEAFVREWTNQETVNIVIGSTLMFISLILLFILTKLVSKTLNRKSKYEKKLSSILTTYDKNILYIRDSYVTDKKKKIIKLRTFEDLLDAREILDKPILYSKINNVKCEFIVEDDEIVYKYVLKEVDVEKE